MLKSSVQCSSGIASISFSRLANEVDGFVMECDGDAPLREDRNQGLWLYFSARGADCFGVCL